MERRARRRELHPAGIDRPGLPGRDEIAPSEHPGTDRKDLVQPRQPGQLQSTRDRGQRQRPDGAALEPGRLQRPRQQPVPGAADARGARQRHVTSAAPDPVVDTRAEPRRTRLHAPDLQELDVHADRGVPRGDGELEDSDVADDGHEVLAGAFAARLHRLHPGATRRGRRPGRSRSWLLRCGWVRSPSRRPSSAGARPEARWKSPAPRRRGAQPSR